MSRYTLGICALVFTLLFAPSGQAQTVESVLRALQERKLVVLYKTPTLHTTLTDEDLIQWPSGIAAFPADGTIKDLPKVLESLNTASYAFDILKHEFVAYEVKRQVFANLGWEKSFDVGGGAGWNSVTGVGTPTISAINLPSIGHFDEQNWSTKLRLLASNVNQLRALRWPIATMVTQVYGGKTTFPPSQAGNNLSFPGAYEEWAESAYTGKGGAETPFFFTWSINGHRSNEPEFTYVGENVNFTSALKAVAGPQYERVTPSSWPKITGPLQLFKSPSAHQLTDLNEKLIKRISSPALSSTTNPSLETPEQRISALRLGTFTPCPLKLKSDSANPWVYQRGEYIEGDLTYEEMHTRTSIADAVKSGFGLMGIPVSQIKGLIEATNLMSLEDGATTRTHRNSEPGSFNNTYSLAVAHQLIFVPAFKEVFSKELKRQGNAEMRVGEVEIRAVENDPVRIHIGRGNEDLNQVAWLSVRPDGFGSMIFNGSPNEFELLYDENLENFEPPIGPRSFDTLEEFSSEAKLKSGWESRAEYFAHWCLPRLRQVKGGDVLVTIEKDTLEDHPYARVLNFYWAGQAKRENANDKFYKPRGAAFKTVRLWNPSIPRQGVKLPSVRNRLKVAENDQRFHDITAEFFPVEPMKPWATYTIRSGKTEACDGRAITLTKEEKSEGDSQITVWSANGTQEGKPFTWTAEHDHSVPSNPGEPRFRKVSSSTSGGYRTVMYTWTPIKSPATIVRPEGGVRYVYPSKAEFSGSADWSDNGRVMEWYPEGDIKSDTRKIGEKNFVVHHSRAMSGMASRIAYKINGDTFRTVQLTRSADFLTGEMKINGGSPSKLRFHGPDAYEPYSFYSVVHPGGFEERSSKRASDIRLGNGRKSYRDIVSVSSGWGPNLANGQSVTTYLNRYGNLRVPGTSNEADGTGGGGAIYHPDGQTDDDDEPSQRVYGPGAIILDEVIASDPTEWGAPRKLTHLRGAVETVSYNTYGISVGIETSRTNPFGVSSGARQFDWLMRPGTIDTGYLSYQVDWSDARKPILTGAGDRKVNATLSAFGELRGLSSDFGDGSSSSFSPTGSSSVSAGQRSASMTIDAAGWVSSISNGLGQRGAVFGFGVDAGSLYTDVTERMKDGQLSAFKVRTHYDGHGRVKSISRLSHTGTQVTDKWEYDDPNRSVTYYPGAGSVVKSRKTTLSADGSTLTISENGKDKVRETSKVEGGKLVRIVEIKNDSSGYGVVWDEVSREEVNPSTGTAVSTPWGMAANAVTVTHSPPSAESTVEIAGGAAGENIKLQLSNGRPSSVEATGAGPKLKLSNFSYNVDKLIEVSGEIGGKAVSMTKDVNGRLTALSGPGSAKAFSYSIGQSGAEVTVTDSVQQTTQKVKTDAVSDLTHVSGSGMTALDIDPKDTTTGTETKINNSVTFKRNHYGAVVSKNYTGGITESMIRNPDGTLQKADVAMLGASGTSISIEESETQIVVRSSDGTITTDLYAVGLPKKVTAPNDGREFTYKRLEPAKETHTAGPFQGWSVERVQDDKGRLGTLKISQGANTVHSFGFGYDNHSRLSLSSSSQLTSTYTIKGTGATETLTRGILQTSWGYDTLDRLSGLTNNNTQGDDFNYSFTGPNDAPARDPRHRIKQKSASIGASWIDLDYDDADQLRFAKAGGREFSYGFDDRGNRIDQGAEVANSVNLLNQIHGRLSKRTYGVRGEVNPGASVKVFDLWNPLGRSLPDPVTGTFAGTWPLPATANTQAQRLDLLVRGTLLPSTTGGKVAISDREISLLVPPVQEALAYDGAGRLKSDAFWGYSWDSFGRLRQMIRKPGVSTRTWSHRRNSRLHLRCPRQADTEDPYR